MSTLLPKAVIRGMSLIEMVVVTAVLSVLMVALTTTVANLYQANGYQEAQAHEVANARRGIDTFVNDVREMTYADNGAYPLVKMQPNLIGFYSDVTGNSNVEYVELGLMGTTTLVERIYDAASSSPMYNFTTPSQTRILSNYVQNQLEGTSTFLYYDQNGNLATSTTPITAIRYVTVQAIVNIDPTRNPGLFMLRSSAALRNIINGS